MSAPPWLYTTNFAVFEDQAIITKTIAFFVRLHCKVYITHATKGVFMCVCVCGEGGESHASMKGWCITLVPYNISILFLCDNLLLSSIRLHNI